MTSVNRPYVTFEELIQDDIKSPEDAAIFFDEMVSCFIEDENVELLYRNFKVLLDRYGSVNKLCETICSYYFPDHYRSAQKSSLEDFIMNQIRFVQKWLKDIGGDASIWSSPFPCASPSIA